MCGQMPTWTLFQEKTEHGLGGTMPLFGGLTVSSWNTPIADHTADFLTGFSVGVWSLGSSIISLGLAY